jgi:hypothetical protein
MRDLQEELKAIHDRNRRVEIDKAWETSLTRRGFIGLITYAVAVLFLWMIDVQRPFLNALVPTGGYALSTLSLPWVKACWLKQREMKGFKHVEY